MNRTTCLSVLLCVSNMLTIRAGEDIAKWNGVYAMCKDVAGFSGELLELKDGKFRYWFYTDVVVKGRPRPEYPLRGNYKMEDGTLTLEHPEVKLDSRTPDELNGVKILWRDDALKHWKEQKRFHPYGILIWTQAELKDDKEKIERPLLRILKDKDVLAKEEKEYHERYNEMPEPARGLFRDSWSREEDERKRGEKTLAELRQTPNPELFKQLVAIMSKYEFSEAFAAEDFIKAMIPATGDNSAALGMFVDAIPMANHRSIEEILVVFMKLSGTEVCDLKIPETDIHIKLKVDGTGKSYGSSGLHGNTEDFGPVATACLKWCREQLAKMKAKQK